MNFKTLYLKIRKAITAFVHFANPTLQDGARILLYHSVGTNRAVFTVSPYQFDRQLLYLVEHNYTILRLSEIIDRVQEGRDLRNCIALTFDDGYFDQYENVFPLLVHYNMPATFFVATGLLGKEATVQKGVRLPFMTTAHMKEMQASGIVDFMPHTNMHQVLDRISHEAACEEIMRSQSFLEDIFDEPIDIFAFPRGRYTKLILTFLQNHGFKGAVTASEGTAHIYDNPYLLKRNTINSLTTLAEFESIVSAKESYKP